MINQEDDFINNYLNAFSILYKTNEEVLRTLYREDIYEGYPIEPGGTAWTSELKALYCAIRLAKPKKVLEIGNFKGRSSNHILLATENNGFGEVTLLDICERIEYDKLHKYSFDRILVDSLEYLTTGNLDYDFFAHDGCHEYNHVKKELMLMITRSITSFDIWSHDYYARISSTVNVKRAWDEESYRFNQWYPLIDSHSNCGFVLARSSK